MGFILKLKELRLFLYTRFLQMERRHLVRENLEESFCTHCNTRKECLWSRTNCQDNTVFRTNLSPSPFWSRWVYSKLNFDPNLGVKNSDKSTYKLFLAWAKVGWNPPWNVVPLHFGWSRSVHQSIHTFILLGTFLCGGQISCACSLYIKSSKNTLLVSLDLTRQSVSYARQT